MNGTRYDLTFSKIKKRLRIAYSTSLFNRKKLNYVYINSIKKSSFYIPDETCCRFI